MTDDRNSTPMPPSDDHLDHAIDQATGDAERDSNARPMRETDDAERTAAALHRGLSTGGKLPERLREQLAREGEAIVGAASLNSGVIPIAAGRPSKAPWLALAACLILAGAAVTVLVMNTNERGKALDAAQQQVAQLESRIEANEAILDNARAQNEQLSQRIADATGTNTELERQLLEASAKEIEYAERLAAVTADLDVAELQLARYEAPVDPAILQANRTRLLEVPDTIRVAWSPFDLPDAPAEQQQVRGDVVWNDELQTGYLRFVGLEVNDPATEQYQVWVIDERGMEQKVSGGVFNATAQGEVIVPIEPGIDVGRVALFAITIENPGGTWVPDLSRRVVVAPRDS